MGLFDGVFAPNMGWLGLQQPEQQSPSIADKLGLLFSDPFGAKIPFPGGAAVPGSDLNRISQLFTDPFGSQNPFPGALGARGGPQQSMDPNAGIPISAQPPMGAPQNVGHAPGMNAPSAPSQGGPTLDQRAYGMSGPQGQMVPPSVIGGAPQIPQQAQTAMAQAPQAAPQQQGPGIGDRLNAGFQGFAHGGALLPALGNLIGGISTGQRQDAAGQPKLQDAGTDMFGQKQFVWVNPATQTVTPAQIGSAPGGGAGSAYLAPGVDKVNSQLTGDAYLNQFGPEVQAAAKAYARGDVLPSGNPRQNSIATLAKTIAQKHGEDIGKPVSDARYSEMRKFRTELGSNLPSTAGGQAKAFNQGIEHMGALAGTLEKLDNSNGLGIPFIADVINTGRQLTSTEQSAISDKARGIGQTLSGEVGKLFSGSAGGGVEERRLTRDRFDTVKSPKQLAAALEGTLETMRGGLTALENRRDQILGPSNDVKFVTEDTEKKIAQIESAISRLKGQAPIGGSKPGVTSNGVKWSVQ